MMPSFSIARLPRIEFGSGSINRLPGLIRQYGNRCLLIMGKQSIRQSSAWMPLVTELSRASIEIQIVSVIEEPSPQLVDEAVSRYREFNADVVVGLGGGSVMDAAKAIAGLLRIENSVMDFLEGVGPELPYTGPAVPFIAVPTTAGTGSEATKNAVLSVQGENGFKKSFRDEQLVPEYALIDPDLLASCPPELIAANGMDALTQLMESYVSIKANPMTDALAISGLRAVRDGLLTWYENRGDTRAAREQMAYGALLSGINLAQTGLGSVHGLASPLGAFFPIPHGVVCGTLVAEATAMNIRAMQAREPDNPGLQKYARLAEILCQRRIREPVAAYEAIVALLTDWTERMQLQRLGQYGVNEKDIPRIVANSRGSSMKTNPIVLTDEEITLILKQRL